MEKTCGKTEKGGRGQTRVVSKRGATKKERTYGIELLESKLLGLGDEEVDKNESDDVETGVESEGSGGSEDSKQSREGDGENRREPLENGKEILR